MQNPGAECRKGNHVTTEIQPGVTRCLWCGAVFRTQQPLVVHQPSPAENARGAATMAHTASGCCGGKQGDFPRPNITERHERELSTAYAGASDCDVSLKMDEHAEPFDIETRFRKMARDHAANSPQLVQWVKSGNKLPDCYR